VTEEQETDSEEDKEMAEYDGIVIENAAEILPSLAKVVGGDNFKPYLAGFLPEFLKRLVRFFYTDE
jgi:hypothetical protein